MVGPGERRAEGGRGHHVQPRLGGLRAGIDNLAHALAAPAPHQLCPCCCSPVGCKNCRVVLAASWLPARLSCGQQALGSATGRGECAAGWGPPCTHLQHLALPTAPSPKVVLQGRQGERVERDPQRCILRARGPRRGSSNTPGQQPGTAAALLQAVGSNCVGAASLQQQHSCCPQRKGKEPSAC